MTMTAPESHRKARGWRGVQGTVRMKLQLSGIPQTALLAARCNCDYNYLLDIERFGHRFMSLHDKLSICPRCGYKPWTVLPDGAQVVNTL
jgi:hypothetical protein